MVDLVRMRPSELRTYSLNVLGTPRAAVRIAAALDVWQRVVVVQNAAFATAAFVSDDASELDNPAAVVPGNAFLLPAIVDVGAPVVLSLAPGQALLAAAGAPGVRISVASSGMIPGTDPSAADVQLSPATFRMFTLPVVGVAAAVRVVPTAPVPRRVVAFQPVGGTSAFLSVAASELNTGGIPGGAYEVQGSATARPMSVFVLAPGQGLYAAGTAGAQLGLSIADIPPDSVNRVVLEQE